MGAIRLQVDIVNRFVLGSVGFVSDFNPAKVFDPTHTLHTWHNESQWISVFRPEHFTVLAIRDEHLA